ncbi:hypothetical protein CB1_001712010 [Camelus ferus]|nr:hypothetical protein CB1_001712010 [Camelus ferus]
MTYWESSTAARRPSPSKPSDKPPGAALLRQHLEESWETEAGVQWTLYLLPGGVLQQAQLLRSLATCPFPDLENGSEGDEGLWLLDVLHQKIQLHLAIIQLNPLGCQEHTSDADFCFIVKYPPEAPK